MWRIGAVVMLAGCTSLTPGTLYGTWCRGPLSESASQDAACWTFLPSTDLDPDVAGLHDVVHITQLQGTSVTVDGSGVFGVQGDFIITDVPNPTSPEFDFEMHVWEMHPNYFVRDYGESYGDVPYVRQPTHAFDETVFPE